MPLTDAACRAAKTENQKLEIADGRGLFLVVGTTGHKSWVLRYKDGKTSRRLTLGAFNPNKPDHVGVAAARAKAAQVKADRKAGIVAAPVPETPPETPAGMTVGTAFALYMRKRWKSEDKTGADQRNRERWSRFDHHFKEALGPRVLSSVTKKEMKTLLRQRHEAMIAAGRTGRGIGNVQAELSAFFSWCVEHDEETGLETNPIQGMAKIDSANERDRWLDRDECGWLLVALREVGNGFAAPCELLLRAGCRKSDIFDLTASMVVTNNDELGPHLLIPDTKNGDDLVVPLTDQMTKLLPPLEGIEHDQCIWPVTGSTSKVKGRVDAKMNELAGRTLEEWRVHDLRTTVGSHLDTFGVDDRVIERILCHKEPNKAKRTYRRYAFYAERKAALQTWNDLLDQLHAKAAAN